MAITSYVRNVSATANGRYERDTFDAEVKADATIAAEPVDYMGSDPPDGSGNFTAYFSGPLTSGAITALDAVVAAHVGINGSFPYEYRINDTLNDTVHDMSLDEEISADATVGADPATYKGHITSADDPALLGSLTVLFSQELGAGAKTALDAVIAAHVGTGAEQKAQVAKISVLTGSTSVGVGWAEIGGVVLDTMDYTSDESVLRFAVYLAHQTTKGVLDEVPGIRLRETLADGTSTVDIMSGSDLVDSGGAWFAAEFESPTPPRAGLCQYTVEARLNGAMSCTIKYVTLAVYRAL